MRFTQIPRQYAPLGGDIRYRVENDSEQTVDIRVHNGVQDFENPQLLGAKRLVRVAEAEIDIAPYLRAAVRFTPTSGNTGIYPPQERIVTTEVEAQIRETASQTETRITAPVRTFIPASAETQAPVLLTTMPSDRIIAEGESDELSLVTDGNCTVTVTAQTPDAFVAQSYHAEGAGLHLFRLSMQDFPRAEVLTVDAGACGSVGYTVVAAKPEGRRLAWRSEAGSIEHYTFPVVKSATAEAEKLRAEGPEGYQSRTRCYQVRTLLRSAFEMRPVLEALAGALASDQVWMADGDHYTPIDVVSTSAEIFRHGVFGAIEIEIRPKQKNRSL